jgi:hypothetical protein
MTQWAVTYHPDFTVHADVVGPFRSRKRAEEVRDRIEAATAHLDVNTAPDVVALETLADALGWIPDPEPHDSGSERG